MDNSFLQDSKKDGIFSQILKRLTALELFKQEHTSIQHGGSNRGWSLFMEQFNTIGAVNRQVNSSQRYNCYSFQVVPGNGDWLEVGIFLNAGDKTCKILGVTENDAGKMDWTLNGVLQTSGQDWYSAGVTLNVEKTFVLTVPITGYYVLRGTINGKNVGSSNYYWVFTGVFIYPASY